MTCCINMSGTGGQGIILAGIILAEAAIMDGKEAVQTQSYGPEARGGASKSEVIISDEPIDYPKVINADVLLAMSQEACRKYIGLLKKGGKLIVDTTGVTDFPAVAADVLAVPLAKTARKELGNPMFASIVALGALVGFSEVVSRESLIAAMSKRIPRGTEAANRQALEAGFRMAEEKKLSNCSKTLSCPMV